MKWLRDTPEAPARNTDAGAPLEDVFRTFSAELRQFVRRRLRQPENAADLTQEVFERFIRGGRHLTARNPHAYLFGIATHVIAEASRSDRRSVVTYDSEASDRAAEGLLATGPDELQAVAIEEELARALDQLSNAQRAAILLTKRDGLSCKEAARKMGTTEGSVRVYVCEARAKLKQMLKRGQG